MAFETPHDGSGTVLTFAGTTYTVTNVVVSATDPTATEDKIAVSHLGQTTGETAKTLDLPLAGAASGDTGRSVTFDYIGKTFIADKSTGSFVLTISGAALSGVSSKNGTVTSSTLTLATQDAIRGQATIKLER
jgi:hypothetical protein